MSSLLRNFQRRATRGTRKSAHRSRGTTMSQQTTVAELREKNEIVINKHIASLNSVGAALQQFLEVLTANAVLQSENEQLKARLASLESKAVEAE